MKLCGYSDSGMKHRMKSQVATIAAVDASTDLALGFLNTGLEGREAVYFA